MIIQRESFLDIGEKVSMLSIPTLCVNPLPMSLSLCLSMLSNESFFVLKTHLHPTTFTRLGNSTRSQTRLDAIEFMFSFMALYHELDSLKLMACENVSGSFLAPIL